MKRILRHIAFWGCYFLFRGIIEYLWLEGSLEGFTTIQYITGSFCAVVLEGLPEVFYVYYFLYRVWPRLGRKENTLYTYLWYAIEALLVLVSSIYLVRLAFLYIIIPIVLQHKLPASPTFEFRRFMSILFNFLATGGLMFAVKYVRLQLTMKEREKKLIKEKLETELKMLRNQMNPHFLFNTLNNIYALTKKKSDKAEEAIMKLSDLLSFMLYRSDKPDISMEEEIQILDNYIELEKLRYDRLSVIFNKSIDDENVRVAPLLLLPLVENAFKHGPSGSRFNSFIDINFILKEKILFFEISNSFEPGLDQVKTTENIGLNNTRRQLELMYKTYNLELNNNDNIFHVKLSINLDTYAEN
jgi:two-component system LytT family sensor kinase